MVVYDRVYGRPLVWDGVALRLTTDQDPAPTVFLSGAAARERIAASVAYYTAAGLEDGPERYSFDDPRQRRARRGER